MALRGPTPDCSSLLPRGSYEDGRLVFTGWHGRVVFVDEDDCDSDGLRAFSERDAQDFVREFRRVKARQ